MKSIKMVNIKFLKNRPNPEKVVRLEILPLAPMSMVSDLPGSYYKSLKSPSKKMICGLFENLLGWHFDMADRIKIIRELKKVRKKQKLTFPETNGSNYYPLLMEFFDIKLKVIPAMIHYDDYWSRAYRRADAKVHPKGTVNLDFELISKKRELPRSDKNPAQVSDNGLEVFFKENLSKFPLYYSTPTIREYIYMDDKYIFKLIMDNAFFEIFMKNVKANNLAYLGTSEGWVDIKIYEV